MAVDLGAEFDLALGPGGWAAVVCWEDGVVEEHGGGLPLTTNSVMEMTAALEGLRALPSGSRVCIVTDSRYLHDGMTSWMAGWRRRDGKTASGDPVKNKEIWVELDGAAADHEQVRWHWVTRMQVSCRMTAEPVSPQSVAWRSEVGGGGFRNR